MRQISLTMVALAFMFIGVMSGTASADTDSATTAPTNKCPERWVDPIYDCVQFENETHYLACARLADKINQMCGLTKPNYQTASAPIFDPLVVDEP